MRDDKGLLQAILDAPADDVPRLVYADWLDENGQAERAEFIRVQIDLARMPEGAPGRAELEAREKDLLARHRADWQGDVHVWARKKARYRRGFVAEIEAKAETFLKSAKGLFGRAPVQGVMLDYVRSEHLVGLTRLPQLSRLRKLGLSGSASGPVEAVRALFAAPGLANLTELDWRLWGFKADEFRAIVTCPHLNNLTHLILRGGEYRAQGLQALAEVTGLPRLTSLQLYGSTHDTYAAREQTNLSPSRVYELQVYVNRLASLDDAAMQVLANVPLLARLTELELWGNRIGPAGAAALAASPHLANLHYLGLGLNRIGAEGAAALARSPHLANLRSLWLVGTSLDEGERAMLVERFGQRVRF